MENKEFEIIYQENSAIVLRYLLRIGCPPQDVEDIIQDTFVNALLSIDSFRGECKLSVWLCQIAKNKFYDSIKKKKREYSGQDMEHTYQDDNIYFEWLELIDDLKEPYKTVFVKKELEGWSYSDIAKIFEKSENWARVTFFRAKKENSSNFQAICKGGAVMKNDCEIVRDLLPVYMEHLCSDSSKAYIEEHISMCSECKKIMEESMAEAEPNESPVMLPNSETVLQKTSWKLHIKAIWCSLGITAIVLFWLVYFWAKLFADQGDYRYFSWSFWEIFSSGSVLFPVLTVIWLAALVIHSIRKKTWKKNTVMALILILLAGAQFGYLHERANIVSVTSWTTVEDIPDEYHIVIENTHSSGNATTILETTPSVTHLVKTDGTIYAFEYEHKKDNFNEGILLGVWDTSE